MFSVDSFFAGVGGIDLGFEQTKQFKTLYANEFDKYANETFRLNFPKAKLDTRSITDIVPNQIPKADVVIGGFPCQTFSIAGYRKGFKDPRGKLFFSMLKMIKAIQPKVVFCENVKNLVGFNHGANFRVICKTLKDNGYHFTYKVMNTKNYGNIPQNRERVYIVAFKNANQFKHFSFPKPIKLTNGLDSVINFNANLPEKYYYRKGKQKYYPKLKQAITSQKTVYQWRRKYVRANKNGVIPTMTANMGEGGSNVPLLLTNSGEIRKMTPRETFNAQGFPASFKLPKEANCHLYKQAGNAVSVPVIKRIAENIYRALKY